MESKQDAFTPVQQYMAVCGLPLAPHCRFLHLLHVCEAGMFVSVQASAIVQYVANWVWY